MLRDGLGFLSSRIEAEAAALLVGDFEAGIRRFGADTHFAVAQDNHKSGSLIDVGAFGEIVVGSQI